MRIFIVEASTRRYDDNLVVTFFSLSWLSSHSSPTSPPFARRSMRARPRVVTDRPLQISMSESDSSVVVRSVTISALRLPAPAAMFDRSPQHTENIEVSHA